VSIRTHRRAANPLPLARWQALQWHLYSSTGFDLHSYRIEPQAHPPFKEVVIEEFPQKAPFSTQSKYSDLKNCPNFAGIGYGLPSSFPEG